MRTEVDYEKVCNSDEFAANATDDPNEEERLVVTPHYLLYDTLDGFGIEVGEWYPMLWESIYNTFMNRMMKSGYAKRTDSM